MLKNDLKTGNLNYVRGVYKVITVDFNVIGELNIFLELKEKYLKKDEVLPDALFFNSFSYGKNCKKSKLNFPIGCLNKRTTIELQKTDIVDLFVGAIYEGLEFIDGCSYVPKHLVLFRVNLNLKIATLDVFKNFYIEDEKIFKKILKEHHLIC